MPTRRRRARRYQIREILFDDPEVAYLDALYERLTRLAFPRPTMSFREFLAYCAITGAKEIEAGAATRINAR